jgi:hypothetical protein
MRNRGCTIVEMAFRLDELFSEKRIADLTASQQNIKKQKIALQKIKKQKIVQLKPQPKFELTTWAECLEESKQ